MTQLVEHQGLDFSSGHDPRVMGSSPVSGSMHKNKILILSFPLTLSPARAGAPSKIKKISIKATLKDAYNCTISSS